MTTKGRQTPTMKDAPSVSCLQCKDPGWTFAVTVAATMMSVFVRYQTQLMDDLRFVLFVKQQNMLGSNAWTSRGTQKSNSSTCGRIVSDCP